MDQDQEHVSILGRQSKELVPIAERPYGPVDSEETVEETVWYNPTNEDVVLDLYVGVPTHIPKPSRTGKPLTWEQRTGKRRYIIRAKSRRAIPSEFDMGIQHHQCLDPECSQKPFACRNRTHRRMIVGGLAPHTLIMENLQHRPVVSDALNDKYRAAEEQKERTVQALLAKSQNEAELADAQKELDRLRRELALKEEQLKSSPPAQKESGTLSERSGIAATQSRVHALEHQAGEDAPAAARPKRSQVKTDE